MTAALPTESSVVDFDQWIHSIGKSTRTGCNWRKRYSWLETVNIAGRVYIKRTSIAEFERRAMAGELALKTNAEVLNEEKSLTRNAL